MAVVISFKKLEMKNTYRSLYKYRYATHSGVPCLKLLQLSLLRSVCSRCFLFFVYISVQFSFRHRVKPGNSRLLLCFIAYAPSPFIFHIPALAVKIYSKFIDIKFLLMCLLLFCDAC